MEKMRFLKSEVISYLEEKILMNEATVEEIEMYEDIRWSNKLKKNYTYKKLIKEMKRIYDGR